MTLEGASKPSPPLPNPLSHPANYGFLDPDAAILAQPGVVSTSQVGLWVVFP
jgi:hypothetical protein